MTVRVADVLEILEDLYDPATAASWDTVGLVTGDPAQVVRRVLFAVDPTQAVIDEAVDYGADLLVTHHPLLLRGVHGVPASTPKGRAVTSLIRGGVALLVAHTNADAADPGVSDALATVLGVRDVRPLDPLPEPSGLKLVTFVPGDALDRVVDALAAAGAGMIGAYERCAWTSEGVGTFRPAEGAAPAIGTLGRVERVAETRLEMVLPARAAGAVVSALRSAHPYEEPAFDLLTLAAPPRRRGVGRVGRLERPVPLRDFAARVASALPATPAGVRVAGDPDRLVETVAVCGGAGDSLLDTVRQTSADVYVTADLRHHPASEALEHGEPALVDCAHWATEWPWLREAERALLAALGPAADTVETRVSDLVTDPWTLHVLPEPAEPAEPADPAAS